MYIVTYTEYGETCDQHSRLLGAYETDEEAEREVFKDMDKYAKNRAKKGDEIDFRSFLHEVWLNGNVGTEGCVWDILLVRSACPASQF